MCVYTYVPSDRLCLASYRKYNQAGMVVHARNLSTHEAEAGGSLRSRSQVQCGLHSSWTASINGCINEVTDVGAFVHFSLEEATATVFFQEPLQHGPALVCLEMLNGHA